MTTIREQLEACLDLAKEATPGPWRDGGRTVVADETDDRLGMLVRLHGGNGSDNRRNATLIAAAVNLIRNPALLEAVTAGEADRRRVEAVRAIVASWRKEAAHLRAKHGRRNPGQQFDAMELSACAQELAGAADEIDAALDAELGGGGKG